MAEKVLSLKEAQALMNRIAELYKIPPIRVVKKDLPSNVLAQFDEETYTIEIGSQTTVHTLLHEAAHYMMALWRHLPDLAEDLAEGFAYAAVELGEEQEYKHESDVKNKEEDEI
jgi:hypothetical protein